MVPDDGHGVVANATDGRDLELVAQLNPRR